MKQKLADRLLLALAPPLAVFVIRVINALLKPEIRGEENIRSFWEKHQGVVIATWHDQLLMMVKGYNGPGGRVLISPSKDGELIARTIQRFGHSTVRGSSSRGGKEAFKELVSLADEFSDLCMTPDGPKGPRHVAKIGVASLAKVTGRPVVPLAFACSNGHRFQSWDRFLLPYPWGRGVFLYGEPLYCRDDEPVDSFRARVEAAMKANTVAAQNYLKTHDYTAV